MFTMKMQPIFKVILYSVKQINNIQYSYVRQYVLDLKVVLSLDDSLFLSIMYSAVSVEEGQVAAWCGQV